MDIHRVNKVKDEIVASLRRRGIDAQKEDWQNFMETVESPSSVVIDINSTKQAIRAMRIIKEITDSRACPLSYSGVAGWKDKTSCPIVRFFKNLLCGPTERYNESFTANPSSTGDIIFRFTPKYQSNKLKMVADGQEVEIPAGIQISKLQQFLGKHKRSIGTATMINKVSVIGAIMAGCQGTGVNQPTLAGLVTELTILKPDGTIEKLDVSHEDFETLVGANMGLTGIVLSARLKTEKQFNLKEQVKHFTSLDDFKEEIPEWLSSEYFTAMITPLYGAKPLDDIVVPNIQVRRWDRTTDKITHDRDVHDYTVEDLASEFGAQVGDEVQSFLLRADLRDILEAFLALTAVIIAGQRGEKARVATANNTMHYQRSFPKKLDLVSFQLPVPDDQAGDILAKILTESERLQREMNDSDGHHLPVTYSTYVRYIKGTSGGLSTCPAKDGHHVLIVEYVTHPLAPGYQVFIDGMRQFYDDNGWQPNFHLGKSLPEKITDFIEQGNIDALKTALVKWYGSKEAALDNNPMFNPFLKSQFGLPLTEAEMEAEAHLKSVDMALPVIDDEKAISLLESLVKKLHEHNPSCDSEADAISQFCIQCNTKIELLKADMEVSQSVSI